MVNIKVELFATLTITFLSVYFFYRFIGPILFDYFKKMTGSKKKQKSLDQMIREQEMLLRSRNQTNSDLSRSFSTKDKKEERTVDQLLKAYKQNKQNLQNDELEKIIELFESLQWGSSTTASEIVRETTDHLGIKFDEQEVTRLANKEFSKNFFFNLPNMESISNYLISFLVLDNLTKKNSSKRITRRINSESPLLNHKIIEKRVPCFYD